MSIRFVRHRQPRSLDDLSAQEQAQLQFAGKLYDGEDLTAADRLVPGDHEESSFAGYLDLWEVDDGDDRYDAWFYNVDSGTIFRQGTLEVVAEVIQFGFEARDPERKAWVEALETAWNGARREIGRG